jgi:hypothetical protein
MTRLELLDLTRLVVSKLGVGINRRIKLLLISRLDKNKGVGEIKNATVFSVMFPSKPSHYSQTALLATPLNQYHWSDKQTKNLGVFSPLPIF